MYIYGAARTSPTPAANAIGSLALFASMIIITFAFLAYRRSTRGMKDEAQNAQSVLGV